MQQVSKFFICQNQAHSESCSAILVSMIIIQLQIYNKISIKWGVRRKNPMYNSLFGRRNRISQQKMKRKKEEEVEEVEE